MRTVNVIYGSSTASPVSLEVLEPVCTWLTAELGYCAADPYAVSLDIDDITPEGLHDTVRWLFSRALLHDGLEQPAGFDGDIQVWPDGTDHVNIRLAPPGHRLHMRVSRSAVCSFLSRTYVLVSAGDESQHFDADDLIAHLLAEGEHGMPA